MTESLRLAIAAQADVEQARRAARSLASALDFSSVEAEAVVLAVSELATNLVRYAESGEILLTVLERPGLSGIAVESRDCGPGIADLERAMQDGFSTGGGLGSGLPAVQRLMDEFEIISQPSGTVVVARKWSARSC